MNHRTRVLHLAAALALVASGVAHSKEDNPVGASVKASGVVLGIPVISVVLVGSVIGSALFGFEGQEGLLSSNHGTAKPLRTKVATVQQREDGSRAVELVVADNAVGHEGADAAVRATVVFPKRDDGASEPVAVGDVLDFKPSPGSSGWTVHRNEGVAIAFLPTPQARSGVASERL